MAGNEGQMWSRVRPCLVIPKKWDALRVENRAHLGTADVNWCAPPLEGWLELKTAARWPVLGGALRVEHFTPEQRVFLLKRRMLGGRADLLLRVGKDWLLFDGEVAAKKIGTTGKKELMKLAVLHMNPLDGEQLRKALTR